MCVCCLTLIWGCWASSAPACTRVQAIAHAMQACRSTAEAGAQSEISEAASSVQEACRDPSGLLLTACTVGVAPATPHHFRTETVAFVKQDILCKLQAAGEIPDTSLHVVGLTCHRVIEAAVRLLRKQKPGRAPQHFMNADIKHCRRAWTCLSGSTYR